METSVTNYNDSSTFESKQLNIYFGTFEYMYMKYKQIYMYKNKYHIT